ncbi:two component system sensor kinase [Pseudomonas chlororaphis]|uniref:two component system sensor kinase n=1 Tax=Pseudomonas chlororaphis TaxID=587753 RepID=UPI000D0EAFC2|nr:two component system sensor kinase [Pseudomonas chlororaphis]AVO60251.1 hybrid sensor histidine kinase/response regulator [Pseudomonas chlororaphis subsp. piscium]
MHKLWQASLTRSVIVTLTCAMSAFWLLSETISFYYRYSKAEVEVREDLDWELNGVAEEENRRYELAQVRVNTLLRLWSELLRNASLPGTQSNELKHTVFVPFDGVEVDQERIAVAGQVIEIFGNSDSVNRTETFLLVPGQGVLFYRPEGQTAADMQAKMHALLSRQYRSTTSDNCWGSVFEDGQGHLRSAVTAIDARSGITAGQLLRIDDLNARKYDFSYILRDAGGRLLWSDNREESALLAAQGVQPDCQRKAMEMAGFIVDCTLLKGPPWQLSAIARGDAVMDRVLPLLGSTAPWTLLAQLLLLVFIALILQRQLGRPLSHIVELIHRQKQLTDLSYRLPEGRKDELGRIASAYNTLLKTLNAYHQTLEDKVRSRTRELDVAKRIAERASHRKSEHLTSISHEIRTPLNGIVGALSLLERSGLSEQQQELIGTARQSSGFLLSIINNLLDFSRIEAGQLELSYEQTAILPMLDQVLLTINLRAQEKRLSLRTLVAANVPRSMSLDSVRVQQILINLLANAVKFTAQGEVCVRLERRAEMLVIAVRDTGKGIPEENQLDIFMPFIQVRAHDNGSGLGLAIASRLANLMGGEILLDSQVGAGSTFTLLLPICDPSEPSLAFSARLPAPAALQTQLAIWGIEAQPGDSPLLDMPELVYLPGRLWQKVSAILFEEKLPGDEPASIAPCAWALKVLVVDDMQVNRDIVGKMLQELGHLAYSASSGEEALHCGRTHVFDWVLMDIRMPDMDGLQVTRLWRDMASGMLDPDTPIMALTANALPDERYRARAAGMNGYLAKPVSLEQLASGVEQVVSLQLARGIDLAPNRKLQQPLINLADTSLRARFYETLEIVRRDIETACRKQDRAGLLMLLHTLKGCAGQGGLDRVHTWAQDQETRVSHGEWLSCEEIGYLRGLILPKTH